MYIFIEYSEIPWKGGNKICRTGETRETSSEVFFENCPNYLETDFVISRRPFEKSPTTTIRGPCFSIEVAWNDASGLKRRLRVKNDHCGRETETKIGQIGPVFTNS